MGLPRVCELPDTVWEDCERILRRFAQQWSPDAWRSLEFWLDTDPTARWGLLVELVQTDLELRWKAGCPLPPTEYLSRYPELQTDPQVLRDLQSSDREFASRFQPTLILNRYELQSQVGRGAFGIVWKAWDTRLRRTVAVKESLPGRTGDPAIRARLTREAHFCAKLQHPHIVAVFDTGEQDDHFYLVMEFIEGPSLSQYLAHGPLAFPDAVRIVLAVAEALAFSHRHGLIHRDIKPGNILLDSANQPRLSDFGLARLGESELTALTTEGQLLGTPAYMAPETVTGDGIATTASDIYSLGVVLYQLLTGTVPFRAELRVLIRQILEDEPRPPRQLSPDIPRDLETVCLKAMAKEPSRRYPNATAFADDLRNVIAGRPVTARPVNTLGRLRRWARRRPWSATLVVALALSITTAIIGIYVQWRKAEKYLADVKEQQNRSDKTLIQMHDAVSDFLFTTVDDPELQTSEFWPVRQRLLDSAIQHYNAMREQSPDDPSLILQLAEVYDLKGTQQAYESLPTSEVLESFATANRFRRLLVERYPENWRYRFQYVITLSSFSSTSQQEGQTELQKEAEREAEALLVELRQKWEADPEAFRHSQMAEEGFGSIWLQRRYVLGSRWIDVIPMAIHLHSGRIAAARENYTDAIRWLTLAHEILDRPVPESESKLGDYERMHYRIILRMLLTETNLKWKNRDAAHQWLSSGHEDAAEYLRLCTDRQQRLSTLAIIPRIREAYEATGDIRSAIAIGKLVASEYHKLAEADPIALNYQREESVQLHELGNLYGDIGNLEMAEKMFRDALEIRQQLHTRRPEMMRYRIDVSSTAMSLGRVLLERDQRSEAEQWFRLSLKEMRIASEAEPNNERLKRYVKDREDILESFGGP